MFISFEGIDGSGKTTQAKLIYGELKKSGKCMLTKEPTQGDIGNFIKKLIKRSKINPMAVQLLFAADRSFHLENLVKPKLAEGYTIITDRYLFSTIAYGKASGIDETWLKSVNSNFMLPDITIIFDIEPKIAMERIETRAKTQAYFEKIKFMEETRHMYLKLAKEYENCFVIDASKPTDTLKDEILSIIKNNAPIV